MKYQGSLPLPDESCAPIDLWLDRARTLVGALVALLAATIFAKLCLGLYAGWWLSAFLIELISLLIVGSLVWAAMLVRDDHYYVPIDDAGHRYFVIKDGHDAPTSMPDAAFAEGRIVPAEPGSFQRKDRLLAIDPKLMWLAVAPHETCSRALPDRVSLVVEFKGEPTAEGAAQVDWLFARMRTTSLGYDAFRRDVEAIRAGHADLPFAFEVRFLGQSGRNF